MADETPITSTHAKRTKYEMLVTLLTGGAALFTNLQGLNEKAQIITATIFAVVLAFAAIGILRYKSAKKKKL